MSLLTHSDPAPNTFFIVASALADMHTHCNLPSPHLLGLVLFGSSVSSTVSSLHLRASSCFRADESTCRLILDDAREKIDAGKVRRTAFRSAVVQEGV